MNSPLYFLISAQLNQNISKTLINYLFVFLSSFLPGSGCEPFKSESREIIRIRIHNTPPAGCQGWAGQGSGGRLRGGEDQVRGACRHPRGQGSHLPLPRADRVQEESFRRPRQAESDHR